MSYFSSCGTIERVTILADKQQHPKGCVPWGRGCGGRSATTLSPTRAAHVVA